MINGFELYEDLNVIVTPLFFLLGKIVLELLGANYLAFRIYSMIILNTCLFFVIYQIFKILKMPKIHAVFFTIFFMIVQMFILLNGFYNYLAILFVLLGILCELKINPHKKYKEFVQGIFIFAIFLSKQNIAVLYLLGRILYFGLKEDKKEWKKIGIELITSAVCLSLFFGYMYIQNKLIPFLDYTLGGLKEFSQNNTFGSPTGFVTILGEIAISIFIMLMVKNKKIPLKSEERNHILLLVTISLCMLGISYPIFNTAHVFMGSICFIIMIIYILDLLIFTPLFYNKKMNQIKKWLIVMIVLISVSGTIGYSVKQYKKLAPYSYNKDTPYYGVLVEEEKRKEIDEILQYIKDEEQTGTKVKIISYYADLYMNLLGRNNGEMDLPFYGNLGKDGEEGLIEQIEQLKNTKILILTEEDEFYQESKKVMDYIKENYPKEGEIRQFSIYSVD